MLPNHGDYWASKPIVAVQGERATGTFYPEQPPTFKRPRQRDCRYEPPYPQHETVVFAMGDPNRVVHKDSWRCYTAWPHLISECGEFKETNRDE
jgi:hypothetical protein